MGLLQVDHLDPVYKRLSGSASMPDDPLRVDGQLKSGAWVNFLREDLTIPETWPLEKESANSMTVNFGKLRLEGKADKDDEIGYLCQSCLERK